MNQRIFLAVLIPKKVQEKIEKAFYPKLQQSGNELKIVPSENLHATMRFLGETPEAEVQRVKERLPVLEKNRVFELQLQTIGSFQERVLWIGVQKGKEELESLCRQISQGLSLQEEPFAGHITLARNKSMPKKKIEELAQELNQIPFRESFLVQSVYLMRSHLRPSGSEYESVLEWKFREK